VHSEAAEVVELSEYDDSIGLRVKGNPSTARLEVGVLGDFILEVREADQIDYRSQILDLGIIQIFDDFADRVNNFYRRFLSAFAGG